MGKQAQDGQEMVRYTVANLVDKTVDGKNLLDFEFHYRRSGAPAEEVPTKYRVIFGGKINKAPRESREPPEKTRPMTNTIRKRTTWGKPTLPR